MTKKSIIWKFLYSMRDLRSKEVFDAIKKYSKGDILDVGGWDFYLKIKHLNLNYNSWITLESEKDRILNTKEKKIKIIYGDGCNMPFEDNSFDLALCIQVLEHVFDPLKMVSEISRILKPSCHGIFLIPQTSILHLAPNHYYNFTKFWIKEACEKAGLQIIELKPIGGFWSTIASRLFHFFPQSFRFGGMSTKEDKRNVLYFLLYPLMALYAVINIPICMLFSLGDLTEEPNNHFLLVKKK